MDAGKYRFHQLDIQVKQQPALDYDQDGSLVREQCRRLRNDRNTHSAS
jgi:hypothetical protein